MEREMTEQQNWELMGQVFKAEVENLRKTKKILESDKKILIEVLLKNKPELTDWVKLNFGERK